MHVLIIEDETRAANHLKRVIKLVAPDLQIIDVIETVREAVSYLQNRQPDFIFSDVQLADGLSFEIYEKVKVKCPIIFTTAYDQYAIEAFKTNGIDYLLKPIEEERLQQALDKVRKFLPEVDFSSLLNKINQQNGNSVKTRFMVKIGDKIKSIDVDNILAFYSFDKTTYIFTDTKRSYPIDYSLDNLTEKIDNHHYFRISRKYIVSIKACENMIAYSNSRLKLTIDGLGNELIIVAREKVKEFKQWLDR